MSVVGLAYAKLREQTQPESHHPHKIDSRWEGDGDEGKKDGPKEKPGGAIDPGSGGPDGDKIRTKMVEEEAVE